MARALITGANRGIGLEICRGLKEKGFEVIALCRQSSEELRSQNVEVIEDIDMASPDLERQLKNAIGEKQIDLLINNAGIMRSTALGEIDFELVSEQFLVNSVAPLRVCQALLPNLSSGAKIAMITSRMGSMADNTSGGSYGYRMSKAALNAASKSLAHDLKERGIAVTVIHPGWVKTDMTRFSGLITTEESAKGILQRIDELSLETTGSFVHTNGEKLPW